jgi:membrane protein
MPVRSPATILGQFLCAGDQPHDPRRDLRSHADPPLLVTVGVAGMVLGRGAVSSGVIEEMRSMVGEAGAQVATSVLESAGNSNKGPLAVVLGFVMLLFGATGVFVQLQDALNIIWEVRPRPGGIRMFIRKRLLSLGMVLSMGVFLLLSVGLSALLSGLSSSAERYLPGAPWLWQALNVLVMAAVFTLLFAAIYKYMPDADIRWRDVWIGAAITAVLFTLGKFGIAFYLGHSAIGSAYGAAGSLVVLLVWIYYSAVIVFFGSEYTQAHARRFGEEIQPAPNAERTRDTRPQRPSHRPAMGGA